MNQRAISGLALAVSLGVAGSVALSNYGNAEQPAQAPLRNPIEQREQMIHELQEIKELLKQQNDLLRQLK